MTTFTKRLPLFAVLSALTLVITRLAQTGSVQRIPHWTEYLHETQDDPR